MEDRWDLNTPLLWLSDVDHWTIKDACSGVQIVGGTGSGKTSGSGQTIAKTYIANGFGGLVLTVKNNEADEWERWAKEAGREKSVIRVKGDSGFFFDFLDYEAQREGGGDTENILDLFTRVVEIVSQSDLKNGDNAYFYLANQQLLRNAIDLCQLANGKVSLSDVYRVVATAPTTIGDTVKDGWKESSYCFKLLSKANEEWKYKEEHSYSLEMCASYFLTEYPRFGDRLRSSITTIFTASADPFLRGTLRSMFSPDDKTEGFNVMPEYCKDGAIIIYDLPIKDKGLIGRVSQSLYKMMFQQCMERRDIKKDGGRPVFLWADENQNFINSFDVEFQQTARSARVLTVYLTQNISNYHVSLGKGEHGRNQATSILGNLATKIFHANSDPSTNDWASSIFGTHWVTEESQSVSKNAKVEEFDGLNVSKSKREIQKQVIESRHFTELLNGGEENHLEVEAIIHQAGRKWKSTNANYLPMFFRQDFKV
mgnify:CR=1 FL=1